MIVGIVAQVAIFCSSEYHALPDELDRPTALVLAEKNRIRPITMSILSAILALLPLVLGIRLRGHIVPQLVARRLEARLPSIIL